MSKLTTVEEVIKELKSLADPNKVAYKAQKFGVTTTQNALGVYNTDLNELVKRIGKNESLALELYDSGIYEARLLCSKCFPPKELTMELIEKRISEFDNWEVCDSFCMKLFAKSSHALWVIQSFAGRKEEFQKRASFATLAAYCMANKKGRNELFESFLPLIIHASDDDRNFVKKAVNWALRGIGKRNIDLNKKALEVAYQLLEHDLKSAQWIAKDAIKELESEKVRMSDYPREIYRP